MITIKESYPETIKRSLIYLHDSCERSISVTSDKIWRDFKEKTAQYVYFFIWEENSGLFSWGTTSGSSDRIRKSSIFNNKLTGKYDRRVDYLMLKIIYGLPKVYVFQMPSKATEYESMIRQHFNQRHCWQGISGKDRNEISNEIIRQFKNTAHYKYLSEDDKIFFRSYLEEVFFAKRVHPDNSKRTFYWGDSLEPNFLPKIKCEHFEPVIERVLKVKF